MSNLNFFEMKRAREEQLARQRRRDIEEQLRQLSLHVAECAVDYFPELYVRRPLALCRELTDQDRAS